MFRRRSVLTRSRNFGSRGNKTGAKNHTFEIINVWADGKYAYQIAKAGVQLIPQSGERIVISGYTVRIFERQDDGAWRGERCAVCNRQDGL